MQRLAWKRGLIGAIAERVHAPPVTLALDRGAGQPRRRCRIHTRQGRGPASSTTSEIYLYALDEQCGPGYHVITPLRLADGGIVLVNRGYVPNELKDPAKRAAGQLTGDVAVTGLLRVARTYKTMFEPDNDAKRNIWYWRDIGADGRDARRRRAARAPIHPRRRGRARRPPGAGPRAASPGSSCPTGIWNTRLTWYGLGGDPGRRVCRIRDHPLAPAGPLTIDAAVAIGVNRRKPVRSRDKPPWLACDPRAGH